MKLIPYKTRQQVWIKAQSSLYPYGSKQVFDVIHQKLYLVSHGQIGSLYDIRMNHETYTE
jgi:hypothetical protein